MKKSSSKRELDFELSDEELMDDSSAKKRRLRSDQVKALERSFEAENKLEPERKVQLAIELGLDPRQVAIWFQNRRARWKTKQLERDYFSLQSAYDDLKRSYDAVQLHNETLLLQIGEMKGKMVGSEFASEKEDDGGFDCGLSLNNGTPFYSNLNVVSSDSATSGVQCEDNGTTTATTNGVVSSYEMIGNEEDDNNLAIWPAAAATYSFLDNEESVPVFNWYYSPHQWT